MKFETTLDKAERIAQTERTYTVELTESEIILIGALLTEEIKRLGGRVGIERERDCKSIFDNLLGRAKFNWMNTAVTILNRHRSHWS